VFAGEGENLFYAGLSGFAPRSESFAIEPLVQVCSISSLSGVRFAHSVRKSADTNSQIL